jgi:hypothetical protein
MFRDREPSPLAEPLWIATLESLEADPLDSPTWRRWRDTAEEEGIFLERTLYDGSSPQTPQAFNALAKLIAALSFMPGGVHVFGQHWEAKRET